MNNTVSLSKMFILDKYFTELESYWETEKKLELHCVADKGGNSSDVDLLKEQLKSLSTELVTLRSSLKEGLSTDDPPHDAMKRDMIVRHCAHSSVYSTLEDLIHLSGPLTEDAIVRALQTRFYNADFYTRIGTILLSVNPYHDSHSSLTLSSTAGKSSHLMAVVQEAVARLAETGHSQAVILSGVSGSGKTYASMQLLRQLFDIAGGGPETDTFKHLSAAFTVLRSLGNAKTVSNTESSRMGQFIEVHVTDGALYRTKIHCYFIDQSRIVKPQRHEKNFHIFYQMLAGLTQDEKVKLYLEGFSAHSLRYLSQGDTNQNEAQDAARFDTWKGALAMLGIPFMDVMRVLAAVVLLGNIEFIEGQGMELDIRGNNEIKSVAALLGISAVSLYKGLTTRTRMVKGQLFKSLSDANTANRTKDSLAKALYSRTLAAVVRRTNSLKSVTATTISSSGSNESVHNPIDTSRISTGSLPSSRSPGSSNGSLRSDGFIGIVDMFGFEKSQENGFEQLCTNLCAETMQHFYNTHIFKSTLECAKDEGIQCEIDVDYTDNAPCIELISSQRTGLLSLLDSESLLPRSTNESYVQRVRVQHRMNPGFFEPGSTDGSRFGIRHYMGEVVYNTQELLHVNRDSLGDDVIAVFHKHHCDFGFATHIFSTELKAYQSDNFCPRGLLHRISPSFEPKEDDGRNTLSQDYYTRLDNLIKTLVHCKPHFLRCIKSNDGQEADLFDRETVVHQIRGLEVLETVNLMAEGFSHRMRFKAFSNNYRFLLRSPLAVKTDNKAYEESKAILERLSQILSESNTPFSSSSWAVGQKHIFLSELTRQQLETLRQRRRNQAATVLQKNVLRWRAVRRWPSLRRTLEMRRKNWNHRPTPPRPAKSSALMSRPRPQPIIDTSDALEISRLCDKSTVQATINAYGLDMENAPPIPAKRTYTVTGNAKVGFPHTRVIVNTYQEDGRADRTLMKGEPVKVVGKSRKSGYLLVEHKNGFSIDVPFQYLSLPEKPNKC